YVAVGYFAGVQRNVQAERRIAGRRLSGVERLNQRQCLARRRQRRGRHDGYVCAVWWQEDGKDAVPEKLEGFAAPCAHRLTKTVEDAVKTPGYFLRRRLFGEVGKASHVGKKNGSSDPADGAALHLSRTDAVGRIAAQIGREQVARCDRCATALDR